MAGVDVLVVDDEQTVCDRLKEHLEKKGYRVTALTDARSALDAIAKTSYPVVVTDLRMVEASGLDVLQAARRKSPATQVIIITGYGSMEAARDAEIVGAYEFLCKPFRLEELTRLVGRAARRAERMA